MIYGLPQKLRNMRLKHRLSQKQVSDRIGVSPSIISGYETGERTPSTEVLLALSHIYLCSTDYLLGRNEYTANNSISVDGLTEQQIAALRLLVESMKNS